jgi:hypothetical protein
MGKAATAVQIPGEPLSLTPSDELDTAAPATDKDAQIAALQAQVAALMGKPSEQLVMEADGPNARKYKAESKHRGYTSAQLDALVKSGEVKLTDHHVLCSDGWYVNPAANATHNG